MLSLLTSVRCSVQLHHSSFIADGDVLSGVERAFEAGGARYTRSSYGDISPFFWGAMGVGGALGSPPVAPPPVAPSGGPRAAAAAAPSVTMSAAALAADTVVGALAPHVQAASAVQRVVRCVDALVQDLF